MSLSGNPKLHEIAKLRCRELRKQQTNEEKMFWEEVRNRKFLGLKIYRQYPLFHDLLGKETFFIADFYCHEKRVVIEVDGLIHKYQKKNDKERAEIINLLGIDVIRFSNERIKNDIDEILKELAKRLIQG